MDIIKAIAGADRNETQTILTGFIMPGGEITYFESNINTIYIRGEVFSFLDSYLEDFWVMDDLVITPEPLPAKFIPPDNFTMLNLGGLSFHGFVKLYVELKLNLVINPFGDAKQKIMELAEAMIYQYINHCPRALAKDALHFLRNEPLYFDYENAKCLYHSLKNENKISYVENNWNLV